MVKYLGLQNEQATPIDNMREIVQGIRKKFPWYTYFHPSVAESAAQPTDSYRQQSADSSFSGAVYDGQTEEEQTYTEEEVAQQNDAVSSEQQEYAETYAEEETYEDSQAQPQNTESTPEETMEFPYRVMLVFADKAYSEYYHREIGGSFIALPYRYQGVSDLILLPYVEGNQSIQNALSFAWAMCDYYGMELLPLVEEDEINSMLENNRELSHLKEVSDFNIKSTEFRLYDMNDFKGLTPATNNSYNLYVENKQWWVIQSDVIVKTENGYMSVGSYGQQAFVQQSVDTNPDISKIKSSLIEMYGMRGFESGFEVLTYSNLPDNFMNYAADSGMNVQYLGTYDWDIQPDWEAIRQEHGYSANRAGEFMGMAQQMNDYAAQLAGTIDAMAMQGYDVGELSSRLQNVMAKYYPMLDEMVNAYNPARNSAYEDAIYSMSHDLNYIDVWIQDTQSSSPPPLEQTEQTEETTQEPLAEEAPSDEVVYEEVVYEEPAEVIADDGGAESVTVQPQQTDTVTEEANEPSETIIFQDNQQVSQNKLRAQSYSFLV